MTKIKTLITALLLLLVSAAPVYGDVAALRGSRYSLSYNLQLFSLLLAVLAAGALAAACILSWKKHDYRTPGKKNWYEWLVSGIVFFLPYLMLAFLPPDKGDKEAEIIFILCGLCSLIYETAYIWIKNSRQINDSSLRHWLVMEVLMIFAFLAIAFLTRTQIIKEFLYSGISERTSDLYNFKNWDVFNFLLVELFIFYGFIFFFVLHRQPKKGRSCYILLHWCVVWGLLLLFLNFCMITAAIRM